MLWFFTIPKTKQVLDSVHIKMAIGYNGKADGKNTKCHPLTWKLYIFFCEKWIFWLWLAKAQQPKGCYTPKGTKMTIRGSLELSDNKRRHYLLKFMRITHFKGGVINPLSTPHPPSREEYGQLKKNDFICYKMVLW